MIEREGAKYLQFAKAFEGQDWPAVYKAAEGERIFADVSLPFSHAVHKLTIPRTATLGC